MPDDAQPTPGPWIYRDGAVFGAVQPKPYSAEYRTIVRPRIRTRNQVLQCGGTVQEHDANGRLIAAAPEMLAALKAIEAHHVEINAQAGRPEERSTTLRLVRAAIAKAEGRQLE